MLVKPNKRHTKPSWIWFIILLPLFALPLAPGTGVSEVQAGLGAPWWSDLAWSPDGSLLAAVGAADSLAVFNADLTLSESSDIADDSYVYYGKLAWRPDGEYLAVNEQPYGFSPEENDIYSLSVWSVAPLTEISRLASGIGNENQPMDLAWLPDGEALLTEVAARLQSVDPLTAEHTLVPIAIPQDEATRYLSFNREVTQAAYILDNWNQQEVRMYGFDLATGEMQWEVNLDDIAEWHTRFVEGTIGVTSFPMDNLAWSSDGQIAISGNFLAIYTPADDSLRVLTAGSDALIHHLEWSPDGRYLAVVVGKTVEIWDAASGERVEVTYRNTETDANRNPYALAWHPDGTRLVVSFVLGSELEAFDMSHLFEEA